MIIPHVHRKTKSFLTNITVLFFLLSIGIIPACRPKSGSQRHYELRGTVVAVEPQGHLVTVSHEAIKDYMPEMTMPFTVQNTQDFANLSPGDQIVATLVVDGNQSWLEDLVISRVTGSPDQTNSMEVSEPKQGTQVPNYTLTNQNGRRITLDEYRGKIVLLTFIYTRCQQPDQCSLMSTNFASIDKRLQEDARLYSKTHLLTITFDPEHDKPEVLRSYGAAYTGRYTEEKFAHWEFLGGTKEEIKEITQFFGLQYYRDPQSGEEQVIHSLRTALIGPDGRIQKLYKGNDWSSEELLRDIRALSTML